MHANVRKTDPTVHTSDVDRLIEPIRFLLNDPQLSEILLNRPKEIWAENSQKQWQRFDVPQLDEKYIADLFRMISNESHQKFDKHHPLLSANLFDGSRIQCVHPPTARDFAFAIRRQAVKNFTLEDYRHHDFYRSIKPAALAVECIQDLPAHDLELLELYAHGQWEAFIHAAIKVRKNIVMSGGTSSGKTTFLNACLREIDVNERIITLEDVHEVQIPHPNKVQLFASKGDQGDAKVTMQDLVQCSLRLRPDRIVMGEIRGGEIMDFVNACSTGHEGSITSVHANNPSIAFMRMCQMYKLNNVPSMTNEDILSELKQVIDVIIQLGHDADGRCATGIYYRYQHLANQCFKKPSKAALINKVTPLHERIAL